MEAGRGALKYRGLAARRGGAASTNFTRLNLGTVWVRWTVKKFKKSSNVPNKHTLMDVGWCTIQPLSVMSEI